MMVSGRLTTMSHLPGGRPGTDPPHEDPLLEDCRTAMALRGLSARSAPERIEGVVRGVLTAAGRPAAESRRLLPYLTGWGPLQPLLDRSDVEEVWWSDPGRVFYSVAGVTRLSNIVLSPADAEAMVMRAVVAAGRRLDASRPFADAPLPDGSRLHVVIPPITPAHWAVNLRRYVVRPTSLGDLVAADMMTADVAAVIGIAVAAGATVLVSGSTHSGKTTMLNALLAEAPGQRVVSCEEVRELQLPAADWVPLQTREPGLEGAGAVCLRDLVRESLRMRPDRIVVGEVRGAEALDLLLAMNCGTPAAATVHAHSAADAVDRLVALPLLAGPNIATSFVARTVAACLDLVIHVGRTATGHRRVRQVARVGRGESGPTIGELFLSAGDSLVRGPAELPREWRP